MRRIPSSKLSLTTSPETAPLFDLICGGVAISFNSKPFDEVFVCAGFWLNPVYSLFDVVELLNSEEGFLELSMTSRQLVYLIV
jgi:hypothetical protein